MRSIFLLASAVAVIFTLVGGSQVISAQQSAQVLALRGEVFNLAHQPVADAIVRLQQDETADIEETHTDASGNFSLSVSHPGKYSVFAEKSGVRSPMASWTSTSTRETASLQLILAVPQSETKPANPSPTTAPDMMEFADKPSFTVAGVTDWTAVGGHGTDASVHTSEVLTRQAMDLKPSESIDKPTKLAIDQHAVETEQRLREAVSANPASAEANQRLGEFYLHVGRTTEAIQLLQTAYAIEPRLSYVPYNLALALEKSGRLPEATEHVSNLLRSNATADVHRLAAQIHEKSGDPLAAVHEFEIAAKISPSEQNYFEWGSELLLHRALSEAEQVLSKGAEAYPKSSRLLLALGTAFLGSAQYEQAALRLCEASDLDPTATEPYMFLGKTVIVSPIPLACIQPRLARLVELKPDNALGNFYYAMTLLKTPEPSSDPQVKQQAEGLLEKTIKLDPKCGDAYLQLGILSSSRHQLDRAVEYYTFAITVNPELSEAHYRLGLAYDRLHEPEKAKAEFAKHDEIEKQQADAIETQRREIKQFQVQPSELPKEPPTH